MAPPRAVDDFDSDDYADEYDGEDYEEGGEEEMSPDDKAAMSNGVAQVKKALGPDASKVTLKQIQDALWHYYYDADKSVAYLRKSFQPQAPKPTPKSAPKKASEGMSSAVPFHTAYGDFQRSVGGTTGADQEHLERHGYCGGALDLYPPSASSCAFSNPPTSLSFDWSDMPWLNVPRERQTVFLAPSRPRGGLLGGGDGTAKMSKLQLLAAARKKKAEEKKGQDVTTTAKNIQKLSLADNNQKENDRPLVNLAKRQKTSETMFVAPKAPVSSDLDDNLVGAGLGQLKGAMDVDMDAPSANGENAPRASKFAEDEVQVSFAKAAPSAFARTLFGSAPEASMPQQPERYAMPYTLSSSFSASAFSEPSPDDIVLAAQAKGSHFSKAK